MNYDERMQRKLEKGRNDLTKFCVICGRGRTRHTMAEARECKAKEKRGGLPAITKVSHISDQYIDKKGQHFLRL